MTEGRFGPNGRHRQPWPGEPGSDRQPLLLERGTDVDEPDDAAAALEDADDTARRRQVIPVLRSSRHFYRLLEGLIEKHGSRPLAVDSVFDLIDLVQRFQPSVVFVNLEFMLDWNADGLERLRLSQPFSQTRIVSFSERWRRDDLPRVPGLDPARAICVPFSVSELDSILLHHLT